MSIEKFSSESTSSCSTRLSTLIRKIPTIVTNDENISIISELCLYSNHLTRLRLNRQVVLPEWVLFYLRARWLKRDFERMCNKWINQESVPTERFKKLEILIPPLQIQKSLIQKLQKLSKTISDIKEKSRVINIKIAQTQESLDILPRRIIVLEAGQ